MYLKCVSNEIYEYESENAYFIPILIILNSVERILIMINITYITNFIKERGKDILITI